MEEARNVFRLIEYYRTIYWAEVLIEGKPVHFPRKILIGKSHDVKGAKEVNQGSAVHAKILNTYFGCINQYFLQNLPGEEI